MTADPASLSTPAASVAASLAHCRQVARTRAGNFYHGMKLTPEPKRSAIYAVYAFMRACDDLADEAGAKQDVEVTRQRIESFRTAMVEAIGVARADTQDGEKSPRPTTARQDRGQRPPDDCSSSVWPAFMHVMRAYPIDPQTLHHMLDGQLADLTVKRYQTFEQLYGYCYNVASTVGLVCISVWGHDAGADDGASVRALAEKRGIALQLTNILRDLREDAQRGRVYLPAEDLDRFGCTAEGLVRGVADDAFDRLMAFQLERARRYYAESAALDAFITRDCRPTSWAIMRIYQKLLDRIAADPRAVLRSRVSLSLPAKIGVGLRAMMRR